MWKRALVGAVLGGSLCSCTIPPDPTVTPTGPPDRGPGYVDVGPGACERLDLPDLTGSLGRPARLERYRERFDGEIDRSCWQFLESDDRWVDTDVVVVVELEDPPPLADLTLPDSLGLRERTAPISGWWSDGFQAIGTKPSEPPGATYMAVYTRVVDRNLRADVRVFNPGVEDDRERSATIALGEAVLGRLQGLLTLESGG